jgi:hypothetical protein
MKTIRLPCFGITVRLARTNTAKTPGAGAITSDLKGLGATSAERCFDAGIDGILSLVLAHACAGVDVASPAYVEGVETAVEAIGNHFV